MAGVFQSIITNKRGGKHTNGAPARSFRLPFASATPLVVKRQTARHNRKQGSDVPCTSSCCKKLVFHSPCPSLVKTAVEEYSCLVPKN